MKLTNTQSMKAKSGMTLLELTVVILVLLSLISILFIGARAWKKGSDRSASILTIRNAQQAVRSFSNMNNKNIGDTIAAGAIFGPGAFVSTDPTTITHPGGAGLSYEIDAPTIIPELGVLYVTVTGALPDGTLADYFMPEGYGTPTSTVKDW
jgi:prepilin-type N-terminal cleavage/methylation domain-containing protein